MRKKAGAYCRVSTTRQELQETIDSQLEELKVKINADGFDLPQENIFIDDGWTGEMLERPGLDSMRDAAEEGQFEILYVYDRGRLSRVYAYQEIIIEEITNKGIQFATLHDIAANTPEERVMQAMQGVFHEYERVKIVERFRRGKLHKARNGILINAQALYGYRYIKKTDTEPARYEINEEEAKIVRMMFHWVAEERLSLYEVRRRLFQKGIPPKKGKNPYWTRGPIIRLLRTDSYVTGKIYYNKSEAIVAKKPTKHTKYKRVKRTSRKMRPREEWIPFNVEPLLVNNGLFEKAQEAMDYYKKYQPKNKKYDYLLSGKVWCECGERRVGDGYSKGGNHYYRCIERIKKFPLISVNCKIQGVNAVITDGLLWQNLRTFLTDKETIKEQAKTWLEKGMTRNSSSEREKQKILSDMQQLKEEELRYIRAFGSGTIAEKQLRILTSEINKKIQLHEKDIQEIENEEVQGIVDDKKVTELCDEAVRVLQSYQQQDKKKVVQDIIDKVTIYNQGKVRVEGHLPQFTQYMGYGTESRNCRVTKCREVDVV